MNASPSPFSASASFRYAISFAAVLACVSAAHGGSVSFSTTAPAVGPFDIAALVPATSQAENVGGADDGVYIAHDRPVQGQMFTTGPNALGYQLTAITLRQVTYNTYCLTRDVTYTVRITQPILANPPGRLTVLYTETGQALASAPDNFPTILDGNNQGPGSGNYITFTFANPVVLSPNTTYGFDLGAGGPPGYYWETDGTSTTNPIPGTLNTAYSSGDNGVGITGSGSRSDRTGDRVFKAALTPVGVAVPPFFTTQPKSVALYAGRTARFTAAAGGSSPLSYRWRKNGTNISDGGNISGTLTNSLSIANVSAADQGTYRLVVTNSGGAATSAPVTLTVVAAPAAGTYAHSVLTNSPVAHWRLDETGDPSSGTLSAFDYAGGLDGTYGTNISLNVDGPQPSAFPGFESTNNAVQTTTDNVNPTWVTVPGLNLNTNTVTIAAWIYPNFEPLNDVGLFITRAGTQGGLAYGNSFVGNGGELTYLWNNGSTYTWKSGLVPPNSQWSFVALVIEPTKATIYLGTNGPLKAAINAIPHGIEAWSGEARIGGDPNNMNRTFDGVIDEVAVFRRALSFDEINALYGTARGSVQSVGPAIVNQPASRALYAGRTARFAANAVGSSPLSYRWRKNGTNLVDGGSISGVLTDTLVINNITAGDAGAYSLLVTNSAGSVTSAPPAMLTVVNPTGAAYEGAVLAANPIAYWRLNDTGNPSTNAPAFDFAGAHDGVYGEASDNAFNNIAGPRPIEFSGLEPANAAVQTTYDSSPSWVTVAPLNLNTNTATFTAWLHPLSDHSSGSRWYSGFLYTRQGTIAGMHYTLNNQLGYTWNGGSSDTYAFASALEIPLNQWSFAAVVIEPSKATLYLYNTNALLSATNPIPHTTEAWTGVARIGNDENDANRTFDGFMDEVAVFNYALSPSQILNLYNAAFSAAPPAVSLTIERVGSDVRLSWPQGTLLEANNISGPYTTNNAASPYTFTPSGAGKFFRVKVQ